MERGNRLNRLLDRALGIPLAAFTALLRCGRAVSAAPPGRVGFLSAPSGTFFCSRP